MHGCIKKESECAIVFPSPLNPCFGSNKRKKEPEKKDRRAIFFEEIESNKWVEHRQNKPKVHLGKISLTHGGTSVLDTDVCFYYVCLDGLLCVCVCVWGHDEDRQFFAIPTLPLPLSISFWCGYSSLQDSLWKLLFFSPSPTPLPKSLWCLKHVASQHQPYHPQNPLNKHKQSVCVRERERERVNETDMDTDIELTSFL